MEELEAEVKTFKKAAMAACENRIDEGKSNISALKRQRPAVLAAVRLGERSEADAAHLREAIAREFLAIEEAGLALPVLQRWLQARG